MEWRPSRERDRERKRVRELRKAMGGRPKARRNQTFIMSRISWEPTMRHQERNTEFVSFESPMAKARGEV